MKPIVPTSEVDIFFEGIFSEPRLRHPEGIAIDRGGNVWCGGEGGEIYRIRHDGSEIELVASTNGFTLGLDEPRDCLYVSDSHDMKEPGPGIWRFDLSTGKGELWYDRPMTFANGMALSTDRATLYVAETFARRVIRIPVLSDGSAGEPDVFVRDIERLPDGLAFDARGNLYVS